jgi:hypothetical protein
MTEPTTDGGTNPLRDFFEHGEHHEIDKWMHYFDVYDRHFARFRGNSPVVLEFGIFHGGSLQMWRDYFGPGSVIHGVDINPACSRLATTDTTIHIGDQEDRDFLRRLLDDVGVPVDVVIEDGGHEFGQQIATFEEIYPRMAPDGVFLIEDLHTSYWRVYGGGLRKPGTFIEYAKGLIDRLNAWHVDERGFTPDDFTRTTRSMHLYPSIVVFERGAISAPESRQSGEPFLRPEDLVEAQLPRAVPPPARPTLAIRLRRRVAATLRGWRR